MYVAIEMVNCTAVNCPSVTSGKKSVSGTGVSFHRLPADKHLRERWKANLKRENPPPDRNIRICSLHFDEDQYEVDLRVSNSRFY